MYKTRDMVVGENRVLVSTSELMDMLGAGRKSALEIGNAAGARVTVGRLVRWNVTKIKRYLETVSE